jgi:hypothetical protein
VSRAAFVIGLAVSLAGHLCLLWVCPSVAAPAPDTAEEARINTVEIAALAQRDMPHMDAPADRPERSNTAPDPQPVVPPPLQMTRTPAPAEQAGGDLAGQPDGTKRPMLRIDWGTAAQAARALALGGMKLVALAHDGHFDAQVVLEQGRWQIRPFDPDPGTAYSNALRIVDRVAAFEPAAAALRLGAPRRRLAVLVPTELEQTLLAAQADAAAQRRVALADVHTFGGRFRLDPAGIGFEITQVRMRRSP